MKGMDRTDHADPSAAFAEDLLRSALRLEKDEQPPRLDAKALAAAAEHRSIVDLARAAVRAVALIGVSLGIEAVVIIVAINALATLDITGPAGVALSLLAAVAQRAVIVGQVTADPSVAIAALAAVLFAIVHERGTGRERIHVRAS